MPLTKLPETPTATEYAKWDAGTSQLSNRVAKALEDEGTKADALDTLANECRMRDAEARRLSIVRDELVLEPGTSPANSERLWKELESLGVARRRLARAAEKLEARKVEVVEADREKGRRERYDAALRFRDET